MIRDLGFAVLLAYFHAKDGDPSLAWKQEHYSFRLETLVR
jgi:hypothetical protein